MLRDDRVDSLGQCPLRFFGANMNSNLMQWRRGKFLGVKNCLFIVQLPSIYGLA